MSKTTTDVITQLEQMMSHGIFDADYIANYFRLRGWQFVADPQQNNSNGGAYFVRTPDGHEGFVNWYNLDTVKTLTENSGGFLKDDEPRQLFLAWVLADQLARIILDTGFDENGESPGAVFESVFMAFKATE